MTKFKQGKNSINNFPLGKESFQTLFENMLEGLAYCELIFEGDKAVDFTYLYVNPAFESLTGLKNVVGKKVTQVIPGLRQSNPEIFEVYARVSATGKAEKFEAQSDNFGGTLAVSAYSPQKGYFIAFFENITERKKTEESLRVSEQRYKTLIDAAPLCIKLFDKEGKLVSVNHYGQKEHFLEGKSENEMRNWDYLGCVEEKYRSLVKEKMAEALAGKSNDFDIKHVAGQTTGTWCHCNTTPVKDAKGQVEYILLVSRDISEEKEVQERKDETLRELEKFKELTIDRELKMIELKTRISELEKELTKESPK